MSKLKLSRWQKLIVDMMWYSKQFVFSVQWHELCSKSSLMSKLTFSRCEKLNFKIVWYSKPFGSVSSSVSRFMFYVITSVKIDVFLQREAWFSYSKQFGSVFSLVTWFRFSVITTDKIDVFLLRKAQFWHDGIQQTVWECFRSVTWVMFCYH